MKLVLLVLTCAFFSLPYFGTTTFITPDTSIPNKIQCSDNALVQYDCDQDCMKQHGALGGYCNKNRVCVCNYGNCGVNSLNSSPNPSPTTYINNTWRVNTFPVQQCGSVCSPFVTAVYSFGCDLDCKCSHGATSGTCNYTSKTCTCNYPSTPACDNITIPANCLDSCGSQALYFLKSLI